MKETSADAPESGDVQKRLQTLNEISRAVSATLDLGALYHTIYRQIGRVMDTNQFLIALLQTGASKIDVPFLYEEGHMMVDQEIPYGDTTTSVIIDRGISLLYNTADEYQAFEHAYGLTPVVVGSTETASGIFVPLKIGSHSIGALSVQSLEPHSYTEEDVQTLSVIASQAAIAIENARLFAQSQDSVRQMQVLLNVARTVTSSLDLQSVLSAILDGIHEVLPFYLAAVLMPNYEQGCLEIVSNAGDRAAERRQTITVPFGQGVTGRAFATGEPVIVEDVRNFPGYIGYDVGVRSELAVPLKRGDVIVGVIDIEPREGVVFTAEQRDLFTLFSSQAAIALENARLFAAQERHATELHTIQAIVQKLTLLHDAPSVALVLSQELKHLIEYHSCRLFLLDANSNTLKCIHPDDRESTQDLEVGEGIAGWIAQRGQAAFVTNVLTDARSIQIPNTPHRDESLIGAPLVFEGKVRGAITLTKLGVGKFDRNDLRLLEIVAAQTAITLDRTRLYSELRTQAVTDELTRLYNRRYLLKRFSQESTRARRNGDSLAVMLVDIDKFKSINDVYGHDAGDAVLRDLATVIRASVRAEDIVSRYGGEEFCAILPELDLDEAGMVAERLRMVLARRRLPLAAGVHFITASLGIATTDPTDTDAEVLTRVDRAMYEAKRSGGNRVCILDSHNFKLVSNV